jgi:hypothetical protein
LIELQKLEAIIFPSQFPFTLFRNYFRLMNRFSVSFLSFLVLYADIFQTNLVSLLKPMLEAIAQHKASRKE